MKYLTLTLMLLFSPIFSNTPPEELAAKTDTNIYQLEKSFTSQPTPDQDYEKLFHRTAYLVGGVIVLLLLTVWVLRRINLGRNFSLNRSNHIQVIERRGLSPKTTLYLVQVGGKMIVLAESQFNVKQVTEFSRNGLEPSESADTSVHPR